MSMLKALQKNAQGNREIVNYCNFHLHDATSIEHAIDGLVVGLKGPRVPHRKAAAKVEHQIRKQPEESRGFVVAVISTGRRA